MSVRRLAPPEIQPKAFSFSADNAQWAGHEIAKYPEGRQASAVIPLLWRAQEQVGGWVPQKAIEHVADVLKMPYIRVLEIATFYTMFQLEPVGKHLVQLCGTTPCQLCGSDALKKVLRERIGAERYVTADGLFSWMEVECLGACCNAPMVQINADYYEDLTADSLTKILDDLKAGRSVKPGSQTGRRASEPAGDVKTLLDPSLYDGSVIGAWRERFEEQDVKVRPAADVAAAAQAAANPEPAKPAPTRSEQRAADTPAHRAAAGKNPAATGDLAGASPKTSPDAEGRQKGKPGGGKPKPKG
jgi:NADH-quinone oxidoreductase subunit E